MAVRYEKRFDLLADRGMSFPQLQRMAGYSANSSTRLRNNDYISLASIEKICLVLDCSVDDIVNFIPDVERSDTHD